MRTKPERHFTIRELIQRGDVSSQDELRKMLLKKGVDVTQATLSRDLKEMGALWVNTADGGMYQMPAEEEPGSPMRSTLPFTVHSIEANESLVVVGTMPGGANAIGEYIDHQRSQLILGTVAGDNTLLVIPRSVHQTTKVVQYLKNILIRGND